MSADENKALVHRLLEEVWSQGKLDVIDEIIDDDWVPHDPVLNKRPRSGTTGVRLFVEMYRVVFPDLSFTVEEMVAEGESVVAFWTARGTHKGYVYTGQMIPPTDKQVEARGMSINHISNGKIKDIEFYWYFLSLLQRVISPPFSEVDGVSTTPNPETQVEGN